MSNHISNVANQTPLGLLGFGIVVFPASIGRFSSLRQIINYEFQRDILKL